MPNYEKMYHVLFSKVSKVIEELQTAQQVTEEIYVATSEDNPQQGEE